MFFFFTSNIKIIHILNNDLLSFLKSRGFSPRFRFYLPKSVYSGFSFRGRFFRKTSTKVAFSFINFSELKLYKCKLKALVKGSLNSTCVGLIKLLNFNISLWSKKVKATSFYKSVALSLDFYLYKLLWKWCKRFHPRRTNSWIFERYWINISGCFKFFSVNILNAKNIFLISHFSQFEFDKRSLCFVSSFEFRDRGKFYYDSFSKLRGSFRGIYGILFDAQQGICPCCNKLLGDFDLSRLRIFHASGFAKCSRTEFNLVLVHACCI